MRTEDEKSAVKREKSCGAVVIRTGGEGRRYLLTRSKKGVWGFPKGHMEKGENEHDTALREILEETGLNVTFTDGFRRTDAYMIFRKDVPVIDKHVVYFLAHYADQTPVPQETEVSEIELFDYEGAMKRLTFDSSRRILAAAERFLRRRESVLIATGKINIYSVKAEGIGADAREKTSRGD